MITYIYNAGKYIHAADTFSVLFKVIYSADIAPSRQIDRRRQYCRRMFPRALHYIYTAVQDEFVQQFVLPCLPTPQAAYARTWFSDLPCRKNNTIYITSVPRRRRREIYESHAQILFLSTHPFSGYFCPGGGQHVFSETYSGEFFLVRRKTISGIRFTFGQQPKPNSSQRPLTTLPSPFSLSPLGPSKR